MNTSTDGPVSQCPAHGEYSLHTGCFPCEPRGRLIALCSPAMASGKSTVAERLIRRHNFAHVAFASPLKAMSTALLTSLHIDKAETHDRIYGSRKEEVVPVLGITSRKLQQLIGTELGRVHIRDSVWVDIALSVTGSLLARGISVVIDDMRFPNEHDAVRAIGGECWRIQRPGAVVTSQHVSEGQLDDYVMKTLVNSRTIQDLDNLVDESLVVSI